ADTCRSRTARQGCDRGLTDVDAAGLSGDVGGWVKATDDFQLPGIDNADHLYRHPGIFRHADVLAGEPVPVTARVLDERVGVRVLAVGVVALYASVQRDRRVGILFLGRRL